MQAMKNIFALSLFLCFCAFSQGVDEVDSLDHYLQTIVQAIELGKNWNEQEALNLEIKKSFVRGLIRYSHNSFKLIEFL